MKEQQVNAVYIGRQFWMQQYDFYVLVNGNTTCDAKTVSGHLLKHPHARITYPRAYTDHADLLD